MTRPRRYLTRMALFLAAVIVIVGLLVPTLADAFKANPGLNGLIVGVLALGIIYIFRQVYVLDREVLWLESFRAGQTPASGSQPRLLAPMATMLGERSGRFSLSAMSMRSVLDSIATRLDESRELSRYLIGLLIFLGLLGTFWGLLETISSIGQVIAGLSVGEGGDLGAVFARLKAGLQAPLSGMGTAFSSSLFGLAGSLVLGFLELQAGQAQNRFFTDLEDWLSERTRLSSGALGADGTEAVPAYVQALLEQTADHLERLERTLAKGEESRTSANNSVALMAERISTLTEQMRTEQNLMVRIAENQVELKPILARLADGGGLGAGDGIHTHVRNLDLHLARLLEESATGRAELVQELRGEIRMLSRTMAAIAERADRSGTDGMG